MKYYTVPSTLPLLSEHPCCQDENKDVYNKPLPGTTLVFSLMIAMKGLLLSVGFVRSKIYCLYMTSYRLAAA